MNRTIIIPVIAIAAMIMTEGQVKAQDWPQYLGPGRNSISTQKNIIHSWPEKGPEILWDVTVGIGFGGTAIRDGKVYLLDRDNALGDKMRCFDLESGKELWSYGFGSPGESPFPGSRSVPAIDGNYIYSCGFNGDLYCIDINTHKPVWNANVWSDFGGGRLPTWAISQCPLIHGNLVIVASQAPQAGVVAFNKLTGKLAWSTPSLGPVGYVSPAIVKVGTENHIVMITAATGRGASASGGRVVGINPSDGAILWDYKGWHCVIPIPSAVDAGEGRMLITGGYNSGSVMLKVEKAGESYQVTELYRNAEFGVHTQPPVLIDGHFYGQCSTNETKNGLMCMSIDGVTRWMTGRNPVFERGSIIYADNLFVITDGVTGLWLVEPDPSAFKALASAQPLKEANPAPGAVDNQNWGPIALSNGRLIIRNQNRLICVRIAN
ncbi:MAG: PQQ-like beta-propeller repeat protein [Bacteroidales bacterium]|nr:PQQ-like beta-propeller repeat protein [Bacteroidales bacterium]